MSNAMKIVQGIPTEADSITETLFKKTNNPFNSTKKVANAANVYKFVANEVQLPVLKDFFQNLMQKQAEIENFQGDIYVSWKLLFSRKLLFLIEIFLRCRLEK